MRKVKFGKMDKINAGILPVYLAKKIDRQVVFFCPYCLVEHTHGLGPIDRSDSKPFLAEHRVAHCPINGRPEAHKRGYYFFYAD